MPRQHARRTTAPTSLPRVTISGRGSQDAPRQDAGADLASPNDEALRALVRALARQAARDRARARGFAPREVGWVLLAGSAIAWLIWALLVPGR